MRAERERALTRLIWVQRIKTWGTAVLAAVVIFGAYVFLTYERTSLIDVTVATATLDGTIVGSSPGQTSKSAIVHVRLDDGREIDAATYGKLQPVPGAHAEIHMAKHQSGLVTYGVVKIDE
jgi:hypothetical protein